MKTTFRRVFFPTAAILLVASFVLGGSFQLLARDYMKSSAMTNLKKQAQTLSEISAAYYTDDSLSSREFYMNLQVCNQVSGADAVICDARGKLVLCSDSPTGCEHTGLAVEQSFLQKVANSGYYESISLVRGLYDEQRYVVAMPIRASSGQMIGIVVVSSPTTDAQRMLHNMTKMYLFITAMVTVVAVVVMAYGARMISRHLRDMASAARDFGHGKLESRVKVEKRSPKEVQELAHAFNNMATSLQKSEQQRQEFVSNVSHELKTPMTTIGGYVDGMLDGTIPPANQEKYMRLVSDETKRLSRLVRSMLDVSRLQAQTSVPEEQKRRFDACECAGRVLVSFEKKIVDKNIDVQTDLPDQPVYTVAVEDSITQVIYNLMDNAVKFCPEGGSLLLSVKPEDKKIVVAVENDGPTIPEEELPLVFERFHKTDKSRSRQKEGWGLGLYIVKSIIQSHGEDITVTSKDGRTRFQFTLPKGK